MGALCGCPAKARKVLMSLPALCPAASREVLRAEEDLNARTPRIWKVAARPPRSIGAFEGRHEPLVAMEGCGGAEPARIRDIRIQVPQIERPLLQEVQVYTCIPV